VAERVILPSAITARFRRSWFNRSVDHDDFSSLRAGVLQRLGASTERERVGDSATSTFDDPLYNRVVELPREDVLQI
jgi:hypothetical protein